MKKNDRVITTEQKVKALVAQNFTVSEIQKITGLPRHTILRHFDSPFKQLKPTVKKGEKE